MFFDFTFDWYEMMWAYTYHNGFLPLIKISTLSHWCCIKTNIKRNHYWLTSELIFYFCKISTTLEKWCHGPGLKTPLNVVKIRCQSVIWHQTKIFSILCCMNFHIKVHYRKRELWVEYGRKILPLLHPGITPPIFCINFYLWIIKYKFQTGNCQNRE